jgi:Ubiquitin fusion degradation protein UFD1
MQKSVPFRAEHFFARHTFNSSGLIEIHQNWINTVLKHLPSNDIETPIIFRIDNDGKSLYVGIQKWHTEIDPVCDDKIAYLPDWMIAHLGLEFNQPISLVPVTLQKAGYIKIRGFTNFINETHCPDRDTLLEIALREHIAIMPDQHIHIKDTEYSIYVCEVKDNDGQNLDAACILNVDLEIDFDRPIDYVTPPPTPPPEKKEQSNTQKKFVPFSGTGNRLTQ